MKKTALAIEDSSSGGTHRLQLQKTHKRLLPEQSTSVLRQTTLLRLGPNISETVRGKLSLGVQILQAGGMEKIFRRIFSVREGEMLVKASQCYLSTTAGPISGMLFISTEKVAFRSDRSIKFSSPDGHSIRYHYKVVIPLRKIKRTNQSENVKPPSQKYLQIVTNDNFEFWFMGFLNYKKTFKCLHQAISQALWNCFSLEIQTTK
ncbi:hypothetical protein Nepgr_012733 [Nepenthes gracilis]|uniref:GRAM domain-containing protein n=1 Tax=Nepenthes gracilis TaxID=150966 RepID=A0AAD3SHU0_NEPGR|nr:hypothetical protein Nepgr_012733 [Nepenthes gracilis]